MYCTSHFVLSTRYSEGLSTQSTMYCTSHFVLSTRYSEGLSTQSTKYCTKYPITGPGPSKPTRDQIKLLYRPIIDELLYLASGHSFTLSEDRDAVIQVYLIAACCDKPAQAILQCISEPIAAYGCGRCEVEGEVISS